MMWIISILIIVLTLSILKDTHVKVYYCTYKSTEVIEEFDNTIPLWTALIIVILGLLPIANIILFIAFIIYYAIHAGWDPNNCAGFTHVFSLRGDNIVTKVLLKIKNLLCKSI